MSTQKIPLFPLGTVLFPGGPLPLRIFEARYVDMVTRCLRENLEFGVVLISAGNETGQAQICDVGTSARIVDWDQGPDGLLNIVARGERRFFLQSAQAQADGLLIGRVSWAEAEASRPLPAKYASMATTLARLLEQSGPLYEHLESKLQDASWVGFRLAELLPIALETRQHCLTLKDAEARLDLLLPLLNELRSQARS